MAAGILDRLLTTLAGHLRAFSVCEVQAGWRLAFPPFDAAIVHCVLKGDGGLRVGNGPWHPFAPRSIIVVPPRRAHALGDPGTAARESRGEEHCALLGDGLIAFTAGDGSRDTLMACGTIAAPRGALDLFDLLRDPVVEDVSAGGAYRQAFDLLLAEVTSPSLGTQAMAEALMQQCLVLMLRRHLLRGEGTGSPLFAALRHPRLARAVTAILDDPAAPHSVESLASLAGMSRASFAEHFSRTFQQGPMDFVQKTRLGIAARLLATRTCRSRRSRAASATRAGAISPAPSGPPTAPTRARSGAAAGSRPPLSQPKPASCPVPPRGRRPEAPRRRWTVPPPPNEVPYRPTLREARNQAIPDLYGARPPGAREGFGAVLAWSRLEVSQWLTTLTSRPPRRCATSRPWSISRRTRRRPTRR